MKTYFLHKKEKSINGHPDNIGYEYNKFIYLVRDRKNSMYLTGIKFSENFCDNDLCPHDTKTEDPLDNEVITCSEKTFDGYIYPICDFIKKYNDENVTIWINKSYSTTLDRDIKIEKIIGF